MHCAHCALTALALTSLTAPTLTALSLRSRWSTKQPFAALCIQSKARLNAGLVERVVRDLAELLAAATGVIYALLDALTGFISDPGSDSGTHSCSIWLWFTLGPISYHSLCCSPSPAPLSHMSVVDHDQMYLTYLSMLSLSVSLNSPLRSSCRCDNRSTRPWYIGGTSQSLTVLFSLTVFTAASHPMLPSPTAGRAALTHCWPCCPHPL